MRSNTGGFLGWLGISLALSIGLTFLINGFHITLGTLLLLLVALPIVYGVMFLVMELIARYRN